MNTCARLESTGMVGKIHLSQQTADLLIEAGKGAWISKRDDAVHAKGKGVMETFWLVGTRASDSSGGSKHDSSSGGDDLMESSGESNDSTSRLIDWNVSMLADLLKRVIASRPASIISPSTDVQNYSHHQSDSFLEEVAEIVPVALTAREIAGFNANEEKIELSEDVQSQLRHFVATVAALYRDNAFHSFQHASHVL